MLTEGQRQALDQLEAVAAANARGLEILSVHDPDAASGWCGVEVSLDTRGIPSTLEGIDVRQRERFHIRIPPGFPFKRPSTWVHHARWAGTPHVQWRRHLCLYQAPTVEWNPSDGMYGFLERLLHWLESAGLGQLDPTGAPLHPPVAYTSTNPHVPLVVPRANTPEVRGEPWVGMAHLSPHGERRVDVVGWSLNGLEHQGPLAAAILLHRPLTFEYPRRASQLLEALEDAGVRGGLVMALWQIAAIQQPKGSPLITVVGAPMRGTAGGESHQHLACWWMAPKHADYLRTSLPQPDDTSELRQLRGELADGVWKLAEVSDIDWCSVREDRPEVTIRRDHDVPMRRFVDQRIAVWGCGALGGHVAEALVRGGVRTLTLIDSASVSPGVLVRQPYDNAHIGQPKATALRERLLRIAPDADIQPHVADLITGPLGEDDWAGGADVVIDTTASTGVGARLELRCRTDPAKAITTISMMIGHDATRGLVTVSPGDEEGGPAHVQRHAKRTASANPRLRDFANDLWPIESRADLFQPEPGCSDPTFVGSEAQAAALAGMMLGVAADGLDARRHRWQFVALPGHATACTPRDLTAEVRPDLVVQDQLQGYEVRLSASAASEMQAWISASERTAGPGVETGGVLFGERDDAARILWITTVTGPPPDSQARPTGFVCGVEGLDDMAAHLDRRTRGAVTPLGVWHTHPDGLPAPSPTDHDAMVQITGAKDRPQPKSLLLIVGSQGDRSQSIACYLHDRFGQRAVPATIKTAPLVIAPAAPGRIGLALSGGGFRAVAFHLGCLRALHDRGVLDALDVISGVSGGSIISALWAYEERSFEEFDAAVVELLSAGLQRSIALRAFASTRTPQAAATALVAGAASALAAIGDPVHRALWGRPVMADGRLKLRRWVSRTTAFEDVLRQRLFGDTTIDKVARPGLRVVINACELRSGSAFRFGSVESGCWRFGAVVGNEVAVARAVAASAAYPMLLPSIDTNITFARRDGTTRAERVLLTDGGVFDNTGISCLEPGRDPEYSYNVHPVDYIISCDAGRGVLDADAFPVFWPGRAKRSFESVYRKVQDASKGRLHEFAESGKLAGFVLPFLGMRDGALPYRPSDLIPREAVVGYPTNFAPMKPHDLALMSRRGEQLTRLLLGYYTPDIA